MEIIENNRIKEKLYKEVLDNGLTIYVFPKKTRKKFIIWSSKFGSNDNKFYAAGESELTIMPDGIAHYLEHKLFEQESGKNSLDVLTSMGVEANAYTTNNHTAFLYSSNDNFYEALDEFMDYVQNPYFTDENIEKERGIIEQEIMMYEDYPEWTLYMNAMKAMYHYNEINIDVAGTKETIAEIDKEKLYKIYYNFYRPDNMILAVVGDFNPEEIIELLKSKITMKKQTDEIRRCYNNEPQEIKEKRKEVCRDISMPVVMMAYKDMDFEEDKVKKDLALGIIGTILLGNSSKLYKDLYEEGKLFSPPDSIYEFADTFGHVIIQFQTNNVEEVILKIENEIELLKQNGLNMDEFLRVKKSVYGDLVRDYNDVDGIATDLIDDCFKGIKPFEYFDKINEVTKEYTEEILRKVLDSSKEVISIVKPLEEE